MSGVSKADDRTERAPTLQGIERAVPVPQKRYLLAAKQQIAA